MTRAGRLWELVATPFVWLFVGALAGWELLVRKVRRRRPPRMRVVDDDEDDDDLDDEGEW